MQPLSVILLPLLASSAFAGVIKARDAVCTMVMDGSNQEGGGGPGQEPINQNAWQVNIYDPDNNILYYKPLSTDAQGSFNYVIQHTDSNNLDYLIYGVDVTGHWDYGTNSWTSCGAYSNNHQNDGTVDPDTIDSNIVSTTDDLCHATFAC